MVVVLSIIIAFAFGAYRAFIQRIIREKNRQHKQELDYKKKISQQSIIVQENERKRIAETLHDEVGSKLNLLSLWINNEETWNNERSKTVVAQIIPELIDTTRTISHELYPSNLEKFGLILKLEELISKIEASLQVEITVKHKYYKKPISFEVQIYRIIQEFLSNVIKHSNASKMNIAIRDTISSLSIVLSDDGIGFDPNKPYKGMGIRNIETRIKSVNANYKWKSNRHKGCTLIIIHSK